jgi:transposase-like protein
MFQKGRNSRQRRLSDEDALAARERYQRDDTLSVASLAREYGMCAGTIAAAITGREGYAHLSGAAIPLRRHARLSGSDLEFAITRLGSVKHKKQIAKELGVSPGALRKALKRVHGIGPRPYLKRSN